MRGWRGLAAFWLVVLLVLAGGAAVLQHLGPPARQFGRKTLARAAAPRLPLPASPLPGVSPAVVPPPSTPPAVVPPAGTPPIGTTAAGPPARIALLMGGIGQSQADSNAAITALPPAVGLAFSPEAVAPQPLVDAALAAGHQVLIGLPLEPQGYPLRDPGPHTLLTGATMEQNDADLAWALSRFTGMVGATSAADGMRGERFAAVPSLFNHLQDQLATQHLWFIDARPGAPAPQHDAGHAVDLVIDDPNGAPAIDAALARLEQIAHTQGSALGLVGTPAPLTIAHIAAWIAGLPGRGLVLVPVGALAGPPETSARR